MDYEGQKLAELLFYWIIISFGGIGWVIGYFQQDFFVVVQAWFVGVVISVIVSTVLYCSRLRKMIVVDGHMRYCVDWKKEISHLTALFVFVYPLPLITPLAVMCTRLALLQPKPYPLARVCSGSTTKGILTA
jgi:ABC-type amino acid transport system permease subunit